MKLHTQPPDVLIVGAGPVGLLTALSLTRHHVPVRVIDKAPGPGVYSYALALHPQTLTILDRLGIAESVLRFATPIHRLAIYAEFVRTAEVDLSRHGCDHPFLAVIPQSALESILIESLAREGVLIEWNHRLASLHLESDQVTGTIERRSQRMMGYATTHMEWMVDEVRPFHVPYLVGADGHQSLTRQLAQIPFPPIGETADFAVFEFETTEPIDPEVKLSFTGSTTNVCWPLNSYRCRWSFQVPTRHDVVDPREKEREYMQIGDNHYQLINSERVRELLALRAPFFTPTPRRIDWRMLVRFDSALADYFNEGNLCLVGDSAHATGPAGMQSMNRGLAEAEHLGHVLARILRDGNTHDTLEDWALSARNSWLQKLAYASSTELLGEADPRLAPFADRLVHSLPATGHHLRDLLGQIGLRPPLVPRMSVAT